MQHTSYAKGLSEDFGLCVENWEICGRACLHQEAVTSAAAVSAASDGTLGKWKSNSAAHTLRLQGTLHSLLVDAALPPRVGLLESVLRVQEKMVQTPELLDTNRARVVSVMYSAARKPGRFR